MSKCIFIIGSVTNAMKAKKILAEYSLSSNTVKLGSVGNMGCVHGIEFGFENKINAARILSKHGIKFEEKKQ